ncbi:hypothetical protein RB195_007688 [Necator americanus]|uniref:Uncharacterized protein n=1 Tax=Necator americanus TaxID=51031 RepID=A0ABR1BZK2_NECAM
MCRFLTKLPEQLALLHVAYRIVALVTVKIEEDVKHVSISTGTATIAAERVHPDRRDAYVGKPFSLQCYNFIDHQYGGEIEHGKREAVECTNPEYCLDLFKEGDDENIYSALCANNSDPENTCMSNSCTNSHGNGFSTKKCCCNTALCNLSSFQRYSVSILVNFAIFMVFVL